MTERRVLFDEENNIKICAMRLILSKEKNYDTEKLPRNYQSFAIFRWLLIILVDKKVKKYFGCGAQPEIQILK